MIQSDPVSRFVLAEFDGEKLDEGEVLPATQHLRAALPPRRDARPLAARAAAVAGNAGDFRLHRRRKSPYCAPFAFRPPCESSRARHPIRHEVPAQEMKTIPISRFRRGCVELLDAASREDEPLVVTRRGKPVARVLPFRGPTAKAEPAGVQLTDRVDFAGIDSPPIEWRWSAAR